MGSEMCIRDSFISEARWDLPTIRSIVTVFDILISFSYNTFNMEKINYQQDDATIYKKAKTRVLIRLWISYLLLLLYFIGVWALLHMDFFAIQESQLSNTLLIVLAAGQLILYFILFLMLSGGYKVFRIFYWICYVFEIALLMVPGYYLINDLSSILVYGALIGCMLVKLIFLSALGSYLKQNRWAKVFFDYVIEIEDDE